MIINFVTYNKLNIMVTLYKGDEFIIPDISQEEQVTSESRLPRRSK